MTLPRRTLLAGIGGVVLLGPVASAARPLDALGGSTLRDAIARIEADSGGRLGVAVLDHGAARRFAWRGDELFPMCSVFKLLLAAAILRDVDLGRQRLERRLPVAKTDLMFNSPFAEERVGTGATVGELCRATLIFSDNAAANILLPLIGGPAGITRFARALGDPVTRLDRNEPTLSEGTPGDPRDTTSPHAMLGDLDRLILGLMLAPASRTRLRDWLIDNRTGTGKLRAAIPAGWRIGDKTGAGGHGTSNDVAVIWPPAGKPLLIASFLTEAEKRDTEQRNAVHAAVARAVVAAVS